MIEKKIEQTRPPDYYFILSLDRAGEGTRPCWWRPSGWGYCQSVENAGRYTYEEARRIAEQSGYRDLPIPVSVFVPGPNAEAQRTD